MPTLDDALSLAARGWEVLPLAGKVPRTPHGVRDATRDPQQLARLWGHGLHNIGARVPSRAVVLDIDPQNGGTLDALAAAAAVPLPETLTVHSGRDTGGQHRYYRHPGGLLTSSRLPGGIDVKTERGYCVMPPSLHPATGKAYRWEVHPLAVLPPALVTLIRPAPLNRPSASSGRPLPERAVHLVRYVEQLREGRRNAGLYWAARRAVEDGHPDETFELLEAAATIAGLTSTEAAHTIASARRGGRT